MVNLTLLFILLLIMPEDSQSKHFSLNFEYFESNHVGKHSKILVFLSSNHASHSVDSQSKVFRTNFS